MSEPDEGRLGKVKAWIKDTFRRIKTWLNDTLMRSNAWLNDNVSSRAIWQGVLGFVIVFAGTVMGYSTYKHATGGFTFDQWMLMVVNWAVPLLSFAGFIAVYLGFKEQKAQNELLEKQLEHQENALLDQKKRFEKQNFEDNFFRLLSVQLEIIDSLEIRKIYYYKSAINDFERALGTDNESGSSSPKLGKVGSRSKITTRSRDCFEAMYEEFKELYTNAKKKSNKTETRIDEEGLVVKSYEMFWTYRKGDLNHYFGNLSSIVSYVSRPSHFNLDYENERFYIDILKGQMSVYELRLLYYHCFVHQDGKHRMHGLMPMLEHYRFFRELSPYFLLDQSHRVFYNQEAFGVG